jgi:hypothetical protein
MRLSRTRLALRAALLLTGAGYMAWRAAQALRSVGEAPAQEASLLRWVAVVEALVAALAVAAAIVALLSLRRRPRWHTLRLGDLDPRDRSEPPRQ